MDDKLYQETIHRIFHEQQKVDERLIAEREEVSRQNINLWFWNGVLTGALVTWIACLAERFFLGG